MPSILYLVPTEAARATYEAAAAAYMARSYEQRDAGFDLFSADSMVQISERISQQVVAAYYDNSLNLFRAFYMLPRSSISRTTLRLSNSVGLIDAGYRGDIMAAVTAAAPYRVSQNERLFQLVAPDLLPWDDVRVVSAIPGGPTLRGTGGFGSTGRVGVSTAALVSTAEEVRALDISGVGFGDSGSSEA